MEPREEFSSPGSANAGGTGARSQTEDKARSVAGQARQMTSRLAGRAREQADHAVSRRKEDAAGRLDTVSEALHEGALRLGRDEDVLARYAHSAAEGVDRLARYLRETDAEALLGDIEGFARRRPELFVGGSFVAGMLLARFLKSSSPRHPSGEPFESGRYAATGPVGGYGSTDAGAAYPAGEPDYPPGGGVSGAQGTGSGTLGG